MHYDKQSFMHVVGGFPPICTVAYNKLSLEMLKNAGHFIYLPNLLHVFQNQRHEQLTSLICRHNLLFKHFTCNQLPLNCLDLIELYNEIRNFAEWINFDRSIVNMRAMSARWRSLSNPTYCTLHSASFSVLQSKNLFRGP